jgi:hypothetical protein
MPSLAAYPTMMQRDRNRECLRVCRAAWLVGVTVREYREMEAGDRDPDSDVWNRLCELYGWPRNFVGRRRDLVDDADGRRFATVRSPGNARQRVRQDARTAP